MKLVSTKTTKTFNLLSIGQRGVGKTVFLVGSYVELKDNNRHEPPQRMWFECQDPQAQENIERALNYVVQTNQYPPATLKVTDFSFSLKRHRPWGTQTLCNFLWHDIPGEICQTHNLEFRKLVSSSHGCCVFIDAVALQQDSSYLQTLQEIIEQVTAIASLVHLNGIKYTFTIVLTKSDLLEPSSQNRQQLEQKLQPLTQKLNAAKADHRIFYSCIPLIQVDGRTVLKAQGAAMPLIWLVWELCKAYRPSLTHQLTKFVTQLLPSSSQPQPHTSQDTWEYIFTSANKTTPVRKFLGIYWFPSRLKYVSLLVLASAGATLALAGATGIIASQMVDFKQLLYGKSGQVADGQQHEQLDQRTAALERLVQQEPKNLELRLQLASLYELRGEVTRAEAAYDQVMLQKKDHFQALSRKAVLSHLRGDKEQAAALFIRAEAAAPDRQKAQVRELAQKTFQHAAQSHTSGLKAP